MVIRHSAATVPIPHERAKPLDLRSRVAQPVRHLRPPSPLYFPIEAEVPEGYVQLHVRTFLFQLLGFLLGDEHTVGSDQFVYWNARDTKRCLSPDVFVKLERIPRAFGSWKTWEQGGPPELVVEIISPNEGDGVTWDDKLRSYHELGIRELVRFDPEAHPGARLRAWDRLDDDLVEREVLSDSTPCQTLGLVWVTPPLERVRDIPACLRLTELDGILVLDARESEAKRADTEAAARAQEAKRADAEAAARREAEVRIRALEEDLRRRVGE
jgi:Uma2 family endonuclease